MTEPNSDPRGPLFVAAYDLWGWLADHVEADRFGAVAQEAVVHHARGLVEAVTLAAEHFDTPDELDRADRHCALLRLHLRSAHDREFLSEEQLLHALDRLRDIGRQIGGWLRSLEDVP